MTMRGIGKKIEVVGIPILLFCIILKVLYPTTFIYTKGLPLYIKIIGIFIHFYSAYMMMKAFKTKKLLITGPYAIL